MVTEILLPHHTLVGEPVLDQGNRCEHPERAFAENAPGLKAIPVDGDGLAMNFAR